TAGVLLAFVFPALLRGASPLGVALTGGIVIAVSTIYLAHGVSDRTTVALVGTIASLLLTAALGAGFAAATHLSGLASEEAVNLLAFAPELDFRGLLLAATILGTLGVLDDVTITQVSAVWELHHSDPQVGARQLYSAGIRIGRDHIASTVNTLILAYTAAALPMLLLFTQSGLAMGEVLTTETLAVEIVQTLVGSIGLVASVPLTTALASWVVTLAGRDEQPERFEHTPRRPAVAQSPQDAFWGRQ
ncbi:MAG TPA: YibE/F family protein, partial [Acidimicrobiales bacterium]